MGNTFLLIEHELYTSVNLVMNFVIIVQKSQQQSKDDVPVNGYKDRSCFCVIRISTSLQKACKIRDRDYERINCSRSK